MALFDRNRYSAMPCEQRVTSDFACDHKNIIVPSEGRIMVAEVVGDDKPVERAVKLLDCLFETSDGGRPVLVKEYDASTIITLLMDRTYRAEVMGQMEDFEGVEP